MLGNGVSSSLYRIVCDRVSSNTLSCLFSGIEMAATIPTNKAGLVLLWGTQGILLYLDLDWADDGAAPGIDSVYLKTTFYPVFCISRWTRLIRLYRSEGRVKSQPEQRGGLILPPHWSLKAYLRIPTINIKWMQNRFHSQQQVFDRKGKQSLSTAAVTLCVLWWHGTLSSECKYEQSDGEAPLAVKKSWYFHNAVTAQRFGSVRHLLRPVPKPLFVYFSSIRPKAKRLILKTFRKLIQYHNAAWINCTFVLQKWFLLSLVIIID